MANYIIVGGASSAIGKALTERLKGQHRLFITSTKADSQAYAAEQQADFACLDACDFAATEALFKKVQTDWQHIDGIVNCAGALLLKPAHLTSASEYQTTIEKNLTTAFSVVRAAANCLRETGGSVVLIASAAAQVGLANHEAVAAAKAGVIALAQSAAASYSQANIRFNVVAPGLVASKLTQALTANPASLKISAAMHPLNRIGQPEHIAAAIEFLLATENDWITGQVLAVDGGLSTVRPKVKA